MWKKVISLFLVLCMLITMVGCWGNPAVPPISPEPENSFSEEFVLVQVIDPESNIIFVTGKENEDAMAILGDKDTEGNPTNVTGAVYVSEQGDSFSIEAGIDGLPTYLIDSEGNKVIFENYTNSTVDISIYDSNGSLIQDTTTINLDPADLLELKQLYNSFYSKGLRWSRKNTADALKWGAVGLSTIGCGLALYATYQTAGLLALTPAVGWACGKASLSLIASITPNDTDNIISMAIGTGSCLISGSVWGCESTILSIIAYGESQSISTIETYIITASAGSHGSISPSGNVTVNQGSDKSFTITPDAGYQIADVLVDGSSVGAVSSYTFTNITQDHTIYATLVVLVNAITDANFSVQYPEGYETDASNMLVWANQVVSTLQKSFPDFLDVIDSRILIVIKDTGDPSQTSADVINTSITFIAPSVAVEESDYYDEDYYIGNIAHELGHIYLDRIRNLTGGYLCSDVPAWFDEGFCEYLRLLVLGEQRFDEKYYWYLPEIPNIVAHGIAGISNIYAGGSWILRFIDSEFGIDTIEAIITSKQSTFLAALTEATNLTLAQFEEQLKEWLKERPT